MLAQREVHFSFCLTSEGLIIGIRVKRRVDILSQLIRRLPEGLFKAKNSPIGICSAESLFRHIIPCNFNIQVFQILPSKPL